jgi:hypothetical protein
MDQTATQNETAPDKIGASRFEPLPCMITDEERAEMNARLLRMLDTIDSKQAAMDAAKKLAKAEIEKDEAEAKKIRVELSLGRVTKPVKVEEHFFYAVGLVREVRTDTHAVIDERPMELEERQPALPGLEDDDSDEDSEGEGGGDDDFPEEPLPTERRRRTRKS